MQDAEARIRQRIDDYGAVFGSDQGKRVLLDLLGHCHVLGSSFDPDPCKTAFAEGQRDVALYILAQVQQGDLAFYKLVRGIPSMSFGPELTEVL